MITITCLDYDLIRGVLLRGILILRSFTTFLTGGGSIVVIDIDVDIVVDEVVVNTVLLDA
jgi:hypothetical protein